MVQRSRTLLLAGLLLAAPLLAGCLGVGSDEDASPTSVTKERADVSGDLGGIEGVVTDEAVQPVEGANVTIVELDETTTTASDGSFAFSLVEPGTYTISVEADGFVSTQQTIDVRANEVATVDFIVTHLQSEQAFTQTIEWKAFIECGVGVGVNLSAAGFGNPQVTWATCATVNSLPGGNATNDDFEETKSLDGPINTLVWEAQWDPGANQLAENLWFVSEIQGFDGIIADNETIHQDVSAASPWLVEIPKEKFQEIADWFESQCKEGNDEYCGHNFWTNGWPLVIETFTATDCVSAPASACAPTQMEVSHVFSAFYNAPAPDGYSVFEGGSV